MARRQELLHEQETPGRQPTPPLRLASPADGLIQHGSAEPTRSAGRGTGTAGPSPAHAARTRRARPERHGLHRHAARHRRSRGSHNSLLHVATSQPLVEVQRMPLWRSTVLALACLVFVLGIASGVMVGAGHLIHLLSPDKRFDIFYALHRPIVRWSLVALCVLWLLPPHPWATRLIGVPAPGTSSAPRRGAHVRAEGTITVISLHLGPTARTRAAGRKGSRR